MSRRLETVDDTAPALSVPPVVAVVVTHDPGPWLEDVLGALAAQDYPNLSVLVLDAASAEDPTPRVAAVLPGAYIRRSEENAGFAATADEVRGVVEGASHLLFMHDDAAPEPDAVRLLVEEAYASNAGIVAPKLVEWDDPARLLAVGGTADKTGVVHLYGRGELDQEQHDAVRDVFVAPGGCLLVRADLFESLGGFDPGMVLFGEDLDLSWRSQIAGARVVVAPAARVRHREATARGERPLELGDGRGDPEAQMARLQLRHRVRSVLKAYSFVHLVRVVPQLAVVLAAEAALALFARRRATLSAIRAALGWNLRHRADLRRERRAAQAGRALKDSEIRRLQRRGAGRLASALRGGLEAEERTFGVASAGRQLADAVSRGGPRLTIAVWLGLVVVLAVGTRELLGGRLPAVGQLVPFPDAATFLREFTSGYRTAGVGSTGPAPAAFGLLGAAGVALFGATGLLQKLVVLGMIPLGIAGVHRATGALGSWRARLVATVLYAAVPLPYDALARGRWSGLVAYGAAPWILARLLRATGLPPFGAPAPAEHIRHRVRRPRAARPADAVEALLGAEAGTLDAIDAEELRVAAVAVAGRPDEEEVAEVVDDLETPFRDPGSLRGQAVALGLVLAVACALAPSVAIATLVAAAGLLGGTLLVGPVRAGLRALATAVGAVVVAAILLAPWTLELLLPGASWGGFAGLGVAESQAPGLGTLLRFETGPVGNGVLGWGFLVVAALPLAVARRWRFDWAARLWAVTVVGVGVAWAAGRGWLGIPPPTLDVLLAPAAAALVLAGALGLAAFERDLPGYRFGWRQIASIVAAVAGLAVTLPIVVAALDGRWFAPDRDFARVLSWMDERRSEGSFRVLWVGEPEALPLDGWRLSDGLAYGTSRDGYPTATELWPGSDAGPTGLLADALTVAREGETTKLGHLVAPMGVRYIAVPTRVAPASEGTSALPVPVDLIAALRAQIDLKEIRVDDALVVYENAAWAPARSVLPPGAADASRSSGAEAARTAELAGAAPVLPGGTSPTRAEGEVPASADVYVAEAASPAWRLEIDGEPAPRRKAFGWANAFATGDGGDAVLRFRTSPLRWLAIALEVVLWLAVARYLIVRLRRARADGEGVDQ